MKGISDIKKILAVVRIVRKIGVPNTISNVKVPCHDENIINVNLSIF